MRVVEEDSSELTTSEQQVLPPLTAQFDDAASLSHNGVDVFTLDVSFSEELAPRSGRKVRNALSVQGGTVTKVRRVAAGDHVRIWGAIGERPRDVTLNSTGRRRAAAV